VFTYFSWCTPGIGESPYDKEFNEFVVRIVRFGRDERSILACAKGGR
jgi:hypothetical protein